MTGELCTLMLPGLTARRLMLTGSRSLSSRRRLLLMRRVISAAVGGVPLLLLPPAALLAMLLLLLLLPWFGRGGCGCGVPRPEELLVAPGRTKGLLLLLLLVWLAPPLELVEGESMLMSSRLRTEEGPRTRLKAGGGGVTRGAAPGLLVSEKVSQKTLPLEFLRACCLKLPPVSPNALEPGSIIIMSSDISSRLSCVASVGLDRAVVAAE